MVKFWYIRVCSSWCAVEWVMLSCFVVVDIVSGFLICRMMVSRSVWSMFVMV